MQVAFEKNSKSTKIPRNKINQQITPTIAYFLLFSAKCLFCYNYNGIISCSWCKQTK